MREQEINLAIIGLGYVGLPLAVAFGKRRSVVGFDVNTNRVEKINQGVDLADEVSPSDLKKATKLICSTDPNALCDCNVFIIAVPTPIKLPPQQPRPTMAGAFRAPSTGVPVSMKLKLC